MTGSASQDPCGWPAWDASMKTGSNTAAFNPFDGAPAQATRLAAFQLPAAIAEALTGEHLPVCAEGQKSCA